MTSTEPTRPRHRTSAGILLHRPGPDATEVLLGHMGGPLWARRDERAWSIPKGEHGPDEDPWDAARREFAEEMGAPVPDGEVTDLGEVRQSGGKIVRAFAVQADFDAAAAVSNTVEIEWPPRSGRRLTIPEIDRAAWFDVDTAAAKLVSAQAGFLERIPWVRWKKS
jgi:predicted NUDIX family NTP pyrophosphohydrolase